MNSAGESEGCVDESCSRINKWLQRPHQRRKRDQEKGRLDDLIDFPPGGREYYEGKEAEKEIERLTETREK